MQSDLNSNGSSRIIFLGKTAGVHGRHGVVEKKQSGVGDKVWIGKRMVLLGEEMWYNEEE